MRQYNRRLYRLARATLRDDAEAEDALQDAYHRRVSLARQVPRRIHAFHVALAPRAQ